MERVVRREDHPYDLVSRRLLTDIMTYLLLRPVRPYGYREISKTRPAEKEKTTIPKRLLSVYIRIQEILATTLNETSLGHPILSRDEKYTYLILTMYKKK